MSGNHRSRTARLVRGVREVEALRMAVWGIEPPEEALRPSYTVLSRRMLRILERARWKAALDEVELMWRSDTWPIRGMSSGEVDLLNRWAVTAPGIPARYRAAAFDSSWCGFWCGRLLAGGGETDPLPVDVDRIDDLVWECDSDTALILPGRFAEASEALMGHIAAAHGFADDWAALIGAGPEITTRTDFVALPPPLQPGAPSTEWADAVCVAFDIGLLGAVVVVDQSLRHGLRPTG